MAIEQANGGATRMEASGDATGLSAQAQGQSYEQITEFLKTQDAPPEAAAPEPETPPAAEPAASPEAAPSVEEYYRLSEDQLAGLPPEVQGHLRRVHKDFQAAYTRKTQALAEERRRLETPPAAPPTAMPPPPAAPVTAAPPEYVEMRRKTLRPELQWMAEDLALGDFQRDQAMQQRYLTPLAQTLQAQQLAARQASYHEVKEDLSARHPGWEAHEDEMVELVQFLQSPALKHPKYGNKLELIYRMVNGGQVQQQAVQQMLAKTAQAATAKSTVSGPAGRSTVPDTEERIRSAKSDTDAWSLIAATVGGKR